MKICWDNLEGVTFDGADLRKDVPKKQNKILYYFESCSACGESYLNFNQKSNYCSKTCRMNKLNGNSENECIVCGKVYIAKSIRTRFCSKDCKAVHNVQSVKKYREEIRNGDIINQQKKMIKLYQNILQIIFQLGINFSQPNKQPPINLATKKCEYCGITFKTKVKGQRFCSHSCRAKNTHAQIIKTCIKCGKNYSGTSYNRKFCSQECSDRRYGTGKCACCGKAFDKHTKQHIYCSKYCSIKASNKNKTVILKSKTCKKCGKNYTGKSFGNYYCSAECYNTRFGNAICKSCNKEFLKSHKAQENCSLECYNNRETFKTCKTCGKNFKDGFNNKYCSTECFNMKYGVELCKICNKEFVKDDSKQIYCSKKCCTIAYLKRNKKQKQIKSCETCGNDFEKGYKKIYCSKDCYKLRFGTGTCKHCGKAFIKNIETKQYCSTKCYLDDTEPKVIENCRICGNEFEYINGKKEYCSTECSEKRFGTATCKVCNNKFFKKSYPQIFCSKDCYTKDKISKSSKKCELTPKIIKCKECGNEFEKKTNSQVYCEQHSRNLAQSFSKVLKAKICSCCGDYYFDSNTKFCNKCLINLNHKIKTEKNHCSVCNKIISDNVIMCKNCEEKEYERLRFDGTFESESRILKSNTINNLPEEIRMFIFEELESAIQVESFKVPREYRTDEEIKTYSINKLASKGWKIHHFVYFEKHTRNIAFEVTKIV